MIVYTWFLSIITHLELAFIQLHHQQPTAKLSFFFYDIFTVEITKELADSQFDIAVVVLT
jgi:hypothetical protein